MLRSAQPGELMLVQADAIDETVQFVRRYVQSITAEPVLPVEVEKPQTAQTAESLESAEMADALLARAPAIAKVEPITQCP